MSILIKANGIYKTFKTEGENQLELFKNLNVEIEKSKITVIVGASGAGKSTLLHILSGLDKPDKGEVFFDGKNIYELNETQIAKLRNQKLGFVFQFHHLLEEFT
ncbi:MAG: ATP-binding cassette domain-containing protein, partial [Ignavibacteria bacterium]